MTSIATSVFYHHGSFFPPQKKNPTRFKVSLVPDFPGRLEAPRVRWVRRYRLPKGQKPISAIFRLMEVRSRCWDVGIRLEICQVARKHGWKIKGVKDVANHMWFRMLELCWKKDVDQGYSRNRGKSLNRANICFLSWVYALCWCENPNTQLVTQSWNRSSLLPFTPVHPTFSYRNGFAFSDIGASFFTDVLFSLRCPAFTKNMDPWPLQDEEKPSPNNVKL